MSFPHFYLQEREVNIVSSSSEERLGGTPWEEKKVLGEVEV